MESPEEPVRIVVKKQRLDGPFLFQAEQAKKLWKIIGLFPEKEVVVDFSDCTVEVAFVAEFVRLDCDNMWADVKLINVPVKMIEEARKIPLPKKRRQFCSVLEF